MGIWKKEPLSEYDNQLGKIRQEKLELTKRLSELDIMENDVLDNRRDAGLKKYMNVELRKKLLNEAEGLGFSHEEIEKLRAYENEWNQDIVSNSVIDEFVDLEKYIKKQAPHKGNLLYMLGKGGNQDDN